ncbi:MAG: hypothetical protein IPP87_22300 [Ideonella sp.]|jgi:hypothetical protein|nr:hypothetical protein [Ideonella sp.]MBL0151241.1 hypothetical protein [Ideonella sp.]
MKSLNVLVAALLLGGVVSAQAQALRPEVGKPLQQASELLRAGKAREAMAKVREAEGAGNKSGAEQLMIDRMKGAAAQRAGDNGAAIQAFEAVFPRVSGGEAAQVAESLAFAYSQAKDWGKTSQWIQKAQSLGGGSAQLKQLQAYVQGQSGDYSAIARDAAAAVSNAEQGGRRPEEGDLLRLADAQARTGNTAGQAATLEKLIAYYPKKDYWGIYLARLQRKSGFSDRFALEIMRLKLATGLITKTEEFMEMSQLALQAGYPAEGKDIVDKGFAAGALGTGAEAERHKRLRDLAYKQEADGKLSIDGRATAAAALKEGNDLVQIGYAYVTMGQGDKGIGLIEQGIAKGGLKRPEDAKLRLGVAMLKSGKAKAKAVQMLRSVQGTDGAADLGRVWALVSNQAS